MEYKNYNDYELIYMIRENDDISINVMYHKYLPIIKNICNKYYQKYSDYGYEYDDFLQEGYVAFQRALITFDGDRDCLFYTYVTVCIQRKLLSFVRDITCRKRSLFTNSYDIDEFDIVDEEASISRIMDNNEIEKMIRQNILDLPIELSSVLELKWVGFHPQEICSLLDISRSTFDYRNRKIRKKLEFVFKKEGKR